jgi:N-acetylglucosaminyl-diphospho-decaprenol L-rhamnosyltransferase
MSIDRSHPLVSLIVVTYNAEGLLPAFFSHLDRTRYEPYEVIVVDNASSDGTVSYLRSERPGVTVIAREVGRGFSVAANQAASIAGGDFLVFMNPDVFVTPEWLEVLVRHLSENPAVGIIAPQSHPPGKTFTSSRVPIEEVAAVPGCAMMVRRSTWEDLGGFDPEFFLYWEDTELCWRAWLLGWRVACDLQAHVIHDEGSAGGGGRWAEEQIKNGLYTYLKLMGWGSVARFTVFHAGKTLVKAALLRRPDVFRAWIWNLRHLPTTLERRRRLQTRAEGRRARAALERRVRAASRRQMRQRVEEWRRRRGQPETQPLGPAS